MQHERTVTVPHDLFDGLEGAYPRHLRMAVTAVLWPREKPSVGRLGEPWLPHELVDPNGCTLPEILLDLEDRGVCRNVRMEGEHPCCETTLGADLDEALVVARAS